MEVPLPRRLTADYEKALYQLDAAAAAPIHNLAEAQELIANLVAQQRALLLESQQLHTSQQELATSEGRLKAAEAIAGLGSYELDLGSGAFHFSEGLYRLLGEEPYSFTPSVAWLDARTDPTDVAVVQQVLAQAQHDKQPYHYTRRIRRPDGQQRVIESHGRVVCDATGAASRLEGVVEDKTEQRQAEQALQASRELLQATLDSSLDMIQVFQAVRDEQGEIVDFTWILNNQVSEARYGNVIGQRLLARNPGVVEVGIFDTFKQVAETGRPDQSERHYTSEQFQGWFYQSTVQLHDGVVTTTVDISALKQSQQQILQLKDELAQRTEDKYRTLFNAIDEGICLFELLYDAQGIAVDYRYLEVNQLFARQTGLANIVGMRGSELAPSAEAPWLETYGRVAQTGEPVRFEMHQASTGRWYEVYACRVGGAGSRQVCTIFHDITERKHREQQQQLLLQLSDALRPLANATAIQEEVTQLTRDFFQADRCYYGEIANGQCLVRRDASAEGLPSIAGTYALASMPMFQALVAAGQPLVVEDVHTTASVDEPLRQLCLQLQVISYINVPVIKSGEAVGTLCVAQATPRRWTPLEVSLAQEVAERTWAAVERARAEEALRLLEERTHLQKEAFQAAINGEPLANSLNTLARMAKEQVSSEVRTVFYLAYPDGASLHAIAGAGDMPDSYTRAVDGFPIGEGSFCSGYAIATGRPALTRDVLAAPLWQPYRQLAATAQFRACSSYPVLTREGKAMGSFAMYFPDVHEATAQEAAVAEAVTQAAAIILSRHTEALERVRAEQALRESEARLRTLLANLPGGAAFIVGPDLRYQLAAGEALLATNYTPADFVGRSLADVLPPSELATHQSFYEQALAGQSFVHEHETQGRAFLSRGAPLRNAAGEVSAVLVVSYDITDRRRAETALRRSDKRLRLAIDAAELGTWDWNLTTNEVRWNARHFILFGLKPQRGPVTPEAFSRHVHPDDQPAVFERLHTAIAENSPFEAEFRVITNLGELRWMSGHGQPTALGPDGRVQRMSGVMLDVTQRKHTEQYLQDLAAALERKVVRRTQALQDSRDLLQSVYDTSLISLALLHAVREEASGAIEDFTFVSANKELTRLTGRPDLVGRRYGQEFPGMVPSGVLALMVQTVETGQPQQVEFFYPYDNINRWLAAMFVKLEDGVVATILDITERKTVEHDLIRNLHLLEQAEAVAQLGSWDYDLASGQFHWSGGMYHLFGLPAGQPVRPSIYLDYVLAEDRPRAKQLVQRLATGAGDFEETLHLRVKDIVKPVRIKAVVLRDAQGQAVRVLGVDLDLSELHRLEADNLRLHLGQQQALFEAVQTAEEEERRRISESLHNGIGQLLYATKLQLDRLPDTPARSPQQEAARLLTEAIRQTRTLSHELTPAILEEFGLEKTLRSICDSLNTPLLHWHCYLEFEEQPLLPLSFQLAIYRLAQELAQNVLKHAQATEATLEVEVLPGWVVLRVEDNGRGFDLAHTNDGLGLRTLRSRVALLRGTVHLATAPGQGTQCQVRIPLSAASL